MKRIDLLDYLRFFAILIVVLYHYSFNGVVNGKVTSVIINPSLTAYTQYGYLGVELFFLISGFVIFYSVKNKTADNFIVSRVLRIYPSYWCAIIFTSLITLIAGAEGGVTFTQFLLNFTMTQTLWGYSHVDGVYWTLLVEMKFYFFIFCFLFFGLKKYLINFTLLWPLLMGGLVLIKIESVPMMSSYYSFFSAGMLFSLLKERKTLPVLFSLVIAYVLCLYTSIGDSEYLTISKGYYHSKYIIGGVVSLFFVIFIFLITNKAEKIKLPLSAILGSLTYPIYLIHAHFGYTMINVFGNQENIFSLCLLVFCLVCFISYIIHNICDVKCFLFFKRLFTITLGRAVNTLQKIMVQ
ncbi:acyltransferase [Vibrio cortegadensis]|uniref:acyltransferase family protein n=1 Tax=Vibrio cortegadensis TaxID=1328770 RepID=UPI0021C2C52B|nr:acyltransferase [Vibrio cortegadensis]MDN3697723.1 acyltransferase [Vibrio cortegadensis]